MSGITKQGASDRRFDSIIYNMDWGLIVSALVLSVMGMLMIYSATLRTGAPTTYLMRQFGAFVVGILFFIAIIFLNYRMLIDIGYYLYIGGLVLLVSVIFLGAEIRGTRGWFNLGLFNFQPVEIAKIIFVVAMSTYLSTHWKNVYRLKNFVIPTLMLALNVGLILMQPDFSSALVYFPVFIFMIFFAGGNLIHLAHIILLGAIASGIPLFNTYIKIKHPWLLKTTVGALFYKASYDLTTAFMIIGIFAVVAFIIWWLIHKLRFRLPFIFYVSIVLVVAGGILSSFVVSHSLKEYQRRRLIVFVDPKIDPLGSGYNILQSKIAIGSGRIFGKGLFGGSQSSLGFLPEQHTDFIFSVVGEELGFLGGMFMLVVYIFFIWRILVIARDARDRGGSLAASGFAVMFIFYFITNIAMTMGLAPVTGLPLPLVSYGGSSMVSSWIAVGILENIHSRRFTY